MTDQRRADAAPPIGLGDDPQGQERPAEELPMPNRERGALGVIEVARGRRADGQGVHASAPPAIQTSTRSMPPLFAAAT
jgi:hypothetical protein